MAVTQTVRPSAAKKCLSFVGASAKGEGVKAIIVLALSVCLSQFAAAQQASTRGPVQQERPIGRPQQITSPAASLPQKVPPPLPAATECDAALATIAVVQPLGPLSAPGGCGAADAVLLESIILPDGVKVVVAPPATLRCTMATEVAHWVREDVAPAAAKLGSPLRGLENLDSYECRGRDRVAGAKLSEHGRANALDVRAFKLANGRTLVLVDPNVSKAFRDALHASACTRFHTVLGPGSDADHAEHVHLDLEERRNNYKICEWDVLRPAQAEALPILPDQVPLPRPRPLAASASRR